MSIQKRQSNRIIFFFVALTGILLLFLGFNQLQKSIYIQTEPNTEAITSTLQELTKPKYQGRLAGSDGNREAMTYIETQLRSMGIAPTMENGTFEQSFKTIIPNISNNAEFTIRSSSGEVLESFEIYKDYNALPSLNGGSVNFNGEMLLVGANLFRIDPKLIKDRVIVVDANRLLPDWVNYVVENEGKGILCCTDTVVFGKANAVELQKNLQVYGKTGRSIGVGYISGAVYKSLMKNAVKDALTEDRNVLGSLSEVTWKVNILFPIKETSNIIGVIKGSRHNGRILMLSANMDGLGEGVNGQYFPGANAEVSGTAVLLEIASRLSKQKVLPYETIVFAFWNGQQQNDSGVQFYLDNPIFPLKRTTSIHLEALGIKFMDGLMLQSDNILSAILKEKLSSYATDNNLIVEKVGPSNSVSSHFVDKGVPSVTLKGINDSDYPKDTYQDTASAIDSSLISNAASVILSYMEREHYPSNIFDYMTRSQKIVLSCLLLGGLLNSGVKLWYKRYPNRRILNVSGEVFYFKLPIVLLRRFFQFVFPCALVVFMLAFLVNIKQTTDVQTINGVLTSNFSLYIILKQTLLYLQTTISNLIHNGEMFIITLNVIKEASYLSIKLIGVTLVITLVVGLMIGILESYRTKSVHLRSLGSILVFSIPDVFVVLIGLIGYTLLYRRFPQIKEYALLKEFILPVITLSIIPTIYVSRIVVVAVLEELNKEYIRAAKALGYSRKKLFMTELLPAVIYKLIDTLPTLMTMLLSNMIIVEYLFNYNGIGYFLLYLYKRQDTERFVPMAITLGLIYSILGWGLQKLLKSFYPSKKEVAK